jgi:elongation factor 2
MPHFKQLPQIQQLMTKKEAIRNLGIIAHIDHGKTTLADSLLAGAGLLSPAMAGSARVLDYLEEEQRRKITIKTAAISLIYKGEGSDYLVNLVDTPGHVDFTGKVTRALRVIDGAVVVVDAVEGIMAQTEIVTRQALEERVRPIVFVNKVDRLITELKLNSDQIQKRFDQLISQFNDLIELYCEEQFKNQWKIAAAAGNVAFGSALHGWGFTLDIAKKKGIKFQEIIQAHLNSDFEKLQKDFPLYAAIFEMTIRCVPNPREAQAYRVEKIWDGHINSVIGKALSDCSDDGPTVVCVTNVQTKQDQGCIATGRVFSGTVKKNSRLHLVDALVETEANQVAVNMGFFMEEVDFVSAGNLAALQLPVMVKPGETLVDLQHKNGMLPFECVNYVSEPVVTLSVEPKNPKDIPLLLLTLDKLSVEDPNLKTTVNQQTGEYLISGMGELHLEVAVNQLKNNFGLQVDVSEPQVVYVECVSKRGQVALAKSPNKQNSFKIQVEPEDGVRVSREKDVDEAESILSFDEYRNVLVDLHGVTQQVSEETLESIIAGFEFACKAGPLCGEPLRHVKVSLVDIQLSGDPQLQSSIEIMHGVGKAIFGSFLTAKPVLLEPIYKAVISAPSELTGECQRILTSRRGKITGFEQKGLFSSIQAFIPVAETFGLAKELRSATSGRALWQSLFDHWEKLPEKEALKIISNARKRKGLAIEVPKPDQFME